MPGERVSTKAVHLTDNRGKGKRSAREGEEEGGGEDAKRRR